MTRNPPAKREISDLSKLIFQLLGLGTLTIRSLHLNAPGALRMARDVMAYPGSSKVSQSLIQTFLDSEKKLRECFPPSRPTPLSFIPPNGTRKSRKSQVFTQTMPESSFSLTLCAHLRLLVQTEAANP